MLGPLDRSLNKSAWSTVLWPSRVPSQRSRDPYWSTVSQGRPDSPVWRSATDVGNKPACGSALITHTHTHTLTVAVLVAVSLSLPEHFSPEVIVSFILVLFDLKFSSKCAEWRADDLQTADTTMNLLLQVEILYNGGYNSALVARLPHDSLLSKSKKNPHLVFMKILNAIISIQTPWWKSSDSQSSTPAYQCTFSSPYSIIFPFLCYHNANANLTGVPLHQLVARFSLL